ncbi:proximal tail sheath stabilization [Synechococcus phage SynMITS9220M01]|nr:proximal tail sheath stabilization [Synechococcus phage SynMITS9220M01]
MFEYFYNEILRKTIISFGTLFNGIEIQHTDSSDNTTSIIKVPLAYGPTQKFLARLEQVADLNKPTAMSLPRMSFEFTGLTYDPTRKVTTTQQFTVKDPTSESTTKKNYMPVPYNMAFEMSIMTKLNDDALQIVEQILPYFQPAYNLTVNLVGSINEKRDIPIVLENITMQDDYEGDYKTRRVLLYTLRFTAKTYLFGPVSDATRDIIRSSRISYLSGTDTTNTERDLTYRVTPRAIKNYTGNVLTNLATDAVIADIVLEVDDGSTITAKTYIDIDNEQLFVKSVSGNKITVERGKDGTPIEDHVKGAAVRPITDDDDDLIPMGDDFGFDGTIS